MSISGSIVGYENNNDNTNNKNKYCSIKSYQPLLAINNKRYSTILTTQTTATTTAKTTSLKGIGSATVTEFISSQPIPSTSPSSSSTSSSSSSTTSQTASSSIMLNTSISSSMGKPSCPSLNSSLNNSIITNASTVAASHHQLNHIHQQQHQQQQQHHHQNQNINLNHSSSISPTSTQLHHNNHNHLSQQQQQNNININSNSNNINNSNNLNNSNSNCSSGNNLIINNQNQNSQNNNIIHNSSNTSSTSIITATNNSNKYHLQQQNMKARKNFNKTNYQIQQQHHQQQQQHQQHHYQQHHHQLQQNLLQNQHQHQQNNYLHLNSLWSIWYGVLMTLFQGYLAIHGAYRFLGCSLIQWKIEPVAELNLQIVLCGVVFILLPLFFASAVFKVGNLANDGIKLATIPNRRCSMQPHDGLEEESNGSTLRALWTHGGPTAAFVHIIIAMCLLLPRLLLEARIIENGLLPRENIWRTELDFISASRDRLVVLSFMTSPYQNISNDYNDTDDFSFLDENLPTNNYNVTENVFHNSPVFDLPNILQSPTSSKYDVSNSRENIDNIENIDDEMDENDNDDDDDDGDVDYDNANLNAYDEDDMDIETINISSPLSTVKSFKGSGEVTQSTTTTTQKPRTSTTTKRIDTTVIDDIQPTMPMHRHLTPSATDMHFTSPHPPRKPMRKSSKNGKKSHHHHHHKNRHDERKSPSSTASRSEEYEPSLEIKSERIDFNNLDEEMSTVFEMNENPSQNNRPYPTFSTKPNSKEYSSGSSEMAGTKKTLHSTRSHQGTSSSREKNLDTMATPTDGNSKIIEIKKKIIKKRMIDEELQVEIEPEYLISPIQNVSTTPRTQDVTFHLAGFAGMLQNLFGVEKEIDVQVFTHPPSMEFVNLVIALIVWSIRYPAVFWTTTKPFSAIFSLHMVIATIDIIFGYTGTSNLYKLQIVSEALPIQNPGLILNGIVTLSLYLLSTILLLSSSLVLYLYGHGRLAARMRDRSMIIMKSSESWIYFSHCASLCLVLALAVVKAPLLNDLSATYRYNLHCPTFLSALISVVQLLLWIVIWLGLTAKRRWTFKLPPVQNYGFTKGATQPLLIATRGLNPSVDSDGGGTKNSDGTGIGGGAISTTSSTDGGVEDIYWPKLTPSSPKLKVTFNEVTSTSDDVLLISEQDGKRHSSRGTTLCITSVAREVDDGDYATLRSGPTQIGVGVGGTGDDKKRLNVNIKQNLSSICGGSIIHLSEYDELPPPPAVLLKPPSQNGSLGDLLDDNTSEEGKLLACVRDDSVTYASTRDLEPPQPPPKPPSTMRSPLAQQENMNLPPSPSEPEYLLMQHQQQQQLLNNTPYHNPQLLHQQHQQQQQDIQQKKQQQQLVSPLAPVTVTVHTNEAHITNNSTPRCLRRGDSGVPNEALTPRSDTTSTTESLTTTSPPERAPSDSSSGVHSGEEREEVVIRPRAVCKPPAKLPQPAIEEEPYARSTNMRMSSFNNADLLNGGSGGSINLNNSNSNNSFQSSSNVLMSNSINNNLTNNQCSATLPLPQRSIPVAEQRIDSYCSSTMPLPLGCHQQQQQQYKSQFYSPSILMTTSSSSATNSPTSTGKQLGQPHHTTLPNGVRYSNPHFLKRLPHVVKGESPYGHLGYGSGHHTFSKLLQDPLHSLAGTSIPEDRDSANYSMSSEPDCGVYMNAHQIN